MINFDSNTIFILLLILTSIVFFVFLIKKNKVISVPGVTKNSNINTEKIKIAKINLNIKDYSNQIISFEKILPNHVPEESNLIEITNSSIVARISQSIPNATETLAKTITNNSIKSDEIYKVLIPSGKQLAESKGIYGAKRGIYRGTKGIEGHADLLKFDPTKVSNASTLANGIANVMNVGSLVVGQYYLSEINSKLENISNEVKSINDFQEREFKSRILTLVARVQKISWFSYEIMENDELRRQNLQTLDDFEGEGAQLLQQVNLAIFELINNNRKIDYEQYQKKVVEFEIQSEYQQILLSILNEISKLIYLFGRGTRTTNLCYSLFNKFYSQSVQIKKDLCIWHNHQLKSLEIDIENNRIKRKGINRVIAKIPAMFDDKWNYKTLKENLGERINTLISVEFSSNSQGDFYEKDVQIAIRDGKYYYVKEISQN